MYYECRHILPSGDKCKSPALHGQSFCYFHHTQRRPTPRTANGTLQLPLIEDAHSIQQSLNAVLHALAAGRLQPRTASLLLYGLQVASSNLRAVGSNDKYSSVRSANTLPDGTLIADNRLVTDFGDTRDTFRQFCESTPAPQEPGEEPLDNDDEEYEDDEEDEDENEDENEDDDSEDSHPDGDGDGDEDEDEDEGENGEVESGEDDDSEEEEDESGADESESDAADESEEEDSDGAAACGREDARSASETFDYTHAVRQAIVQNLLPNHPSLRGLGQPPTSAPAAPPPLSPTE
jgi:hypothetical protein